MAIAGKRRLLLASLKKKSIGEIMILSDFLFYMFSSILVVSALMVVASRNPVHSVLFLIVCFFNTAALFILMGAEFVAFILIIVYAGAVAVLFLFVVMMLDINFRELRRGFLRYLPIGAAVGLIMLVQLVMAIGAWNMDKTAIVPSTPLDVENTRALGRILYTHYIYPFQMSGIILLIAMIGAITLTLRERKDVRRQDIREQLKRSPKDVLEIRKVKIGEGVK